MKGQYNFWNGILFDLFLEVSQIQYIGTNKIEKKIIRIQKSVGKVRKNIIQVQHPYEGDWLVLRITSLFSQAKNEFVFHIIVKKLDKKNPRLWESIYWYIEICPELFLISLRTIRRKCCMYKLPLILILYRTWDP